MRAVVTAFRQCACSRVKSRELSGALAVCLPMAEDVGLPAGRNDVYVFFTLGCGITWALDLPLALAWATHAGPPACAMPLFGLRPWGPPLPPFVFPPHRRQL